MIKIELIKQIEPELIKQATWEIKIFFETETIPAVTYNFKTPLDLEPQLFFRIPVYIIDLASFIIAFREFLRATFKNTC